MVTQTRCCSLVAVNVVGIGFTDIVQQTRYEAYLLQYPWHFRLISLNHAEHILRDLQRVLKQAASAVGISGTSTTAAPAVAPAAGSACADGSCTVK